jgi:hypothetical protein
VATSAIQTALDLSHQNVEEKFIGVGLTARAAYFAADRASLCVGALFGPEGKENMSTQLKLLSM